jgi:hypothetical protein
MTYWLVEIKGSGEESFTWPGVHVIALRKRFRAATALVGADPDTMAAIQRTVPRVKAVQAVPLPLLHTSSVA